MDADMKRMMAEMQASIQGLSTQMQASIHGLSTELRDSIEGLRTETRASIKGLEERFDGLEGRFDGLEGRFDGLEKKFKGLSMEFIRTRHELRQDFRNHAEEMKGIYNHAAWAAESARASGQKGITHGPMLTDHEDRIRALEGKRKPPPAA